MSEEGSPKMPENARLSRKQVQLLQGLVLGQTLTATCAAIGINEKTGYRWLRLPLVQAERERLENEIRQTEEQEITRIMTTGYAAVHERVKALDYQARRWKSPTPQNVAQPTIYAIALSICES